MRLQVLSDLHLEVCGFTPVEAAADVVVLAGDVHQGTRGLEWAAQAFAGRAIVHIPGNHEYYDGEFAAVRQAMRSRARQLGIVHLDDAAAVVNGVRFVGATLWAVPRYGSTATRTRASTTKWPAPACSRIRAATPAAIR